MNELRAGPPSARLRVELLKLYVAAETRRPGLAAGLLRAVLDAGIARGARRALLGVIDENARAVRFYLSSGFHRCGSRRFLLRDEPRYDLTMVLQLWVDGPRASARRPA